MPRIIALHGSARDETDLVEFSAKIAPHLDVIAPRGDFPEGDGYTFFRRRSDRSVPGPEVCALAEKWLIDNAQNLPPLDEEIVLAGYSSGAIFAEALIAVRPERFAAAILLRPEPLADEFTFPGMAGKPILILAGRHDERRQANDAPGLATQLRAAEARVSLHVLDTGHGWAPHDEDARLVRAWLAQEGIG